MVVGSVGDDAEVLRGILRRLLTELEAAETGRELKDLSAEVRQVLGALRDAGAVGGEVAVVGVVERVVGAWGEVVARSGANG